MGKLEGRIALVAGGNSGIGLATASQFVNEGAHPTPSGGAQLGIEGKSRLFSWAHSTAAE
jgi:hypothetical protein